MLTETKNPSALIINPERKQPESIFQYYSISNEIAFLKKYPMTMQEKQFYITENLVHFLTEFAGKVPYKKISYLLEPDGFYFAGMRPRDSYQHTCEIGGPREQAELAGFSQIESQFQKWYEKNPNELPTEATWISPSISTYGVVFHFKIPQNQYPNSPGLRVDEYILTYPETKNKTGTSQHIYKNLTGKNDLSTTDDFLIHPILEQSNSTQTLFNLLGIDNKTIKESEAYEFQIRQKLVPFFQTYFDLINKAAVYNQTGQENINELETLVAAIYNIAQEIKEEQEIISTKVTYSRFLTDNYFVNFSDTNALMTYVYQQALKRPATVFGGGSCPTVNKTNTSNLLLADSLSSGTSIESYIKGEDKDNIFECPACHVKINTTQHGPIGDECPHCHITVKQAMEKGLIDRKCE